MRLSSLRRQPTLVDVGPAGYQEFTAGTIPVRGVLADEEGALVLVEHQRGFMRAFDEHLSAVRTGGAPLENVDYTVTWTAITGWEPWPPVVRLELKIDGLQCPTQTPVQGRDDVAAVAPRRRRLLRAGSASSRPGTGVCVELHVDPRPDSRRWRPRPHPR